jgi:hypothetical protein
MARHTPIEFAEIGPWAMRPPASTIFLSPKNSRRSVPKRQLCDLRRVHGKLGIICHYRGARPPHGDGCDR